MHPTFARAVAISVTVAALTAAPCARADEPETKWRGAVAAGTELPMSVGVRGQVEAPFRVRLSTTLGVLPGPYVSAINGFLVGIGAYGDDTATLVKSTLSSSLIWRTHVGYRPFAKHGFTVEGGYGLVTLGGGATQATLVTALTGREAPNANDEKTYSARSTLHMLDIELGWEWEIVRHLFARVALGGAFTVGSSTTITPDFQPRAPRLTTAFASYGEAYLDDVYTSYVFTPVASVWAGYAF